MPAQKLLLALACVALVGCAAASVCVVHDDAQDHPRTLLAAKEVRRYLYLRTAELPLLIPASAFTDHVCGQRHVIAVAHVDSPLVSYVTI